MFPSGSGTVPLPVDRFLDLLFSSPTSEEGTPYQTRAPSQRGTPRKSQRRGKLETLSPLRGRGRGLHLVLTFCINSTRAYGGGPGLNAGLERLEKRLGTR